MGIAAAERKAAPLDFSKLKKRFGHGTQQPPAQGKIPAEWERRLEFEGITEALQRAADEEEAESRTAANLSRAYQTNILLSREGKGRLLNGLLRGEDLERLLLTALELIARMSNDELFLKHAKESLLNVYGLGLLEKKPLELLKEETESRARKLAEAVDRETEEAARYNLDLALARHIDRMGELEALTEKAEPESR